MSGTLERFGKPTLDISGWNTSKVTKMDAMFGDGTMWSGTGGSGHGSGRSTPNITSINFGPGWSTSNVESMWNIFSGGAFTIGPTPDVDLILKGWDLI